MSNLKLLGAEEPKELLQVHIGIIKKKELISVYVAVVNYFALLRSLIQALDGLAATLGGSR